MQFVLLIFCLLTIVGAFSSWRHSPLYSLKTTLKLVGGFVLIAAVVAGTSMAIVNSPVSRSPAMEGVAAFLAILVLGSSASIFIVRITDSHVAQLPATARLVRFNRHKVYRWIWRLMAFVLICAVAALVLPSSWNWLPSGLGGFMLLVCGPMLSISYMMARRNDRGMSAVIANPWAHWQYTSEQWAQWAKNQREWEEAQEGHWRWKPMLLFVLLCAGLFSLGTLFSGGDMQESAIIVSGLTGFVILLVLLAYWFKRTNFDRRYRRLLASAPEAWFGDEGLFCNGTYMPWILSGRYLLKATVAADPPARVMLVFQSFNGSSSVLVTQRIPIPDDHVSDLRVLQGKIDACCPTASVHLLAS
jgi:protein-S-isoprenylcysteine O-methyltransferase Ste14